MPGSKNVIGNFAISGVVSMTGVPQVAQELQKATGRINQYAGSLKGHAPNQRRFNQLMLEASRGVEDFALVFSTQGITGGLRGALNNLSQMGTIIHPLAGAFVGFSTVLTVMAMPAIQAFADSLFHANKEMEKISNITLNELNIAEQTPLFKVEDFFDVNGITRTFEELELSIDRLIKKRNIVQAGIEKFKKQGQLQFLLRISPDSFQTRKSEFGTIEGLKPLRNALGEITDFLLASGEKLSENLSKTQEEEFNKLLTSLANINKEIERGLKNVEKAFDVKDLMEQFKLIAPIQPNLDKIASSLNFQNQINKLFDEQDKTKALNLIEEELSSRKLLKEQLDEQIMAQKKFIESIEKAIDSTKDLDILEGLRNKLREATTTQSQLTERQQENQRETGLLTDALIKVRNRFLDVTDAMENLANKLKKDAIPKFDQMNNEIAEIERLAKQGKISEKLKTDTIADIKANTQLDFLGAKLDLNSLKQQQLGLFPQFNNVTPANRALVLGEAGTTAEILRLRRESAGSKLTPIQEKIAKLTEEQNKILSQKLQILIDKQNKVVEGF